MRADRAVRRKRKVGLASAGAVVLLAPVLALLAPYAYARSRKVRA